MIDVSNHHYVALIMLSVYTGLKISVETIPEDNGSIVVSVTKDLLIAEDLVLVVTINDLSGTQGQ